MSKWPYTTRRWGRLRKQKLQRDPLCEMCLQIGEIVPADVVDHRIPISERGRKERDAAEAYPSLDALASLDARCHNRKTRYEQVGEDYLAKGCDVFGNPLDRNHPWYRDNKKRVKT